MYYCMILYRSSSYYLYYKIDIQTYYTQTCVLNDGATESQREEIVVQGNQMLAFRTKVKRWRAKHPRPFPTSACPSGSWGPISRPRTGNRSAPRPFDRKVSCAPKRRFWPDGDGSWSPRIDPTTKKTRKKWRGTFTYYSQLCGLGTDDHDWHFT